MASNLVKLTQEVVKYKKMAEEEQGPEILISNKVITERHTLEKQNRSFLCFKCCAILSGVMVTLNVLCLTLSVLYFRSIFSENVNSSCIPFQQIEKVVISSENTTLNTCSDNTTCNILKDTIEQKYEGLKYNFVIGENGELYIGAGFKCLNNTQENAMYVKLLTSEPSEYVEIHKKKLKMCIRLHELIKHGISCGIISHNFTIQDGGKKMCSSVVSTNKSRSHHVHDPHHHVKLLHGNFRWTFCENSSSPIKHRVVSPENFPISSCPPLDMVTHVEVKIENTTPFNCSDELSCLQTYEKHHDGLKYNFIIGFEHVYVGLGFNCRAEGTDGKTLRMKVLALFGEGVNLKSMFRWKQIIEDGLDCGKISVYYQEKVEARCDPQEHKCLEKQSVVDIRARVPNYESEHYNISSEHGKGIVPHKFRHKFCHSKNGTSISAHESNIVDLSTTLRTPLSTSILITASQSTTTPPSTSTSPRTTTSSTTSPITTVSSELPQEESYVSEDYRDITSEPRQDYENPESEEYESSDYLLDYYHNRFQT